MGEEHLEQVERWANYVREHPDDWKPKLKRFLDAQIIIARRSYNELSKTEEGREKIRLLKELKAKSKV